MSFRVTQVNLLLFYCSDSLFLPSKECDFQVTDGFVSALFRPFRGNTSACSKVKMQSLVGMTKTHRQEGVVEQTGKLR